MMLVDLIHRELGWPTPDEVFTPSGDGARVLAQLASEKLGKAIARLPGGNDVQVGVLVAEPDATDAPLALVCRFPNPVPAPTLYETQKLAWNFSRSLLLITMEPQIIRKWSCCEIPIDITTQQQSAGDGFHKKVEGPEIEPAIPIDTINNRLDQQAARSLWWVELISGRFFEQNERRFPQEQRADRMLLANLKEIRRMLREAGLDDTFSHDLLARVIFVQFLFDRKDSSGHAALNSEKLYELYRDDILSAAYTRFADILANYDDAYALFQWLNQRFNGDLFPGKGATPKQREDEWRAERDAVKQPHLDLLADFVRGDIELRSGQLSLWPQYAFDAIPLEFISSIYEEFVNNDEGIGVHYTRSHVVDLMLDRVLPWNSAQWDLRVLDPACGSGIFLVKAFQRLIYRWKFAHRNHEIGADVLRHLLENNLFGVDKDANAVRVASFSLYLAMCDEIDPRHYWSDPDLVHFPPLRTRRIVNGDFFDEDKQGFRTKEDAATYDLVLGNPPWGDTSATLEARTWAKENHWPIANNDFGVLFLAKGAALTKPSGRICMVQSASSLLYNLEKSALRLRRKIFADFVKVENVINLAAFKPFRDVRVPTCILTLRNEQADGEPFWYMCPKPQRTGEDEYRVVIEPQDVHLVYPQDPLEEPWVWSVLMWGGSRDRMLIRRLSQYPNLERLREEGVVKTRQGFYRGDRQRRLEGLEGWRAFEGTRFPRPFSLKLDATSLPALDDPYVHSRDSSDVEPFRLPQLTIKTSWVRNTFRFQARFIDTQPALKGVMCSRSMVSVHADDEHRDLLQACTVVYNSDFANYYLFLTSGRLAFDRSEPIMKDLRRLPIPQTHIDMDTLDDLASLDDVDRRVQELFALREAETILVDDFLRITLPDYKRMSDSTGRRPTHRRNRNDADWQVEPELNSYCSAFQRVLAAAYGEDKYIGAVIFSEEGATHLPVRMISIHLNAPDVSSVHIEPLRGDSQGRLRQFYKAATPDNSQFSYGRCIRTYDSYEIEMSSGQQSLVVNIIKPDQIRYWTRSMALRDADDVVADLRSWGSASDQSVSQEGEVLVG